MTDDEKAVVRRYTRAVDDYQVAPTLHHGREIAEARRALEEVLDDRSLTPAHDQ